MAQKASISPLIARACAKINLSLEILGRRPDGYHELVSLVAFARDVFDQIYLRKSANPTGHVNTGGAYSDQILGENIASKTVRLVQEAFPDLQFGDIEIIKSLPVASGIGGGSADAAAVLRLIALHNNLYDPEALFRDISAEIGADVPVCVGGQGCEAAIMGGKGERVLRPSGTTFFSEIDASVVLVNPGVQVATAQVFSALGADPRLSQSRSTIPLQPFASFGDLVTLLEDLANDLERPAKVIAPEISDTLKAIAATPHCCLARMSGSGATCFGLFQRHAQAQLAAEDLRAQHPKWWIASSRLG
ncbi:MAG: 4-(cytidine 5'-diphospho)-2-C-methyl-D-erythritol kinase [Hyphomicrobiaceae bacterium]